MEAVDAFRKQIKEDPDSAESLFQLKSAMKHLNPTYSWECEDCKTSQTSPVFPSTDNIASFKAAMHSDLWGEVVDSARTETCTKCGREAGSTLILCEGCYEEYIGFVVFSSKGSGLIVHSMSMKMPSCPKCGYRPKTLAQKDSTLQKRYAEMLKKYPEMEAIAKTLRKSGLLK